MLTLWARGADGARYAVPDPVAVEVTWGMDSPAHSMELSFLRQGPPLPPLVEAELHSGEQVLFRGFCDQQREESGPGGRSLQISARSRGGLLLDNEAQPKTYFRADTGDIFRAHVLPYGITRLEVPRVLSAGLFEVQKGRSEWEVFCAFCMRMYGRLPWLDSRDGVRVAAPDRTPAAVVSNDPARPGALRYQSLCRTLRRSSVVSRIVIRDRDGNYSSAMETRQKDLGVQRRRFIIPAAEYATTPTADAFQRLQRSSLGFYSLGAVLPGLAPVELGDAVLVADPLCGQRVLTVYQRILCRDPRGLQTRLTLADPEYL